MIWAGTDDGNVWLTRDGGGAWTEVDGAIPAVPKGLWVSRVLASAADANTAYVAFDGHRSDNRGAWLFRTTDGGKTWTNLSGALAPNQPVYVIEEDSKNPDLLFVGTEFGLQVSLDRGRAWRPMMNGLPTVAVYDMIIHPRDRDVILGTHGRGIYVLDDITRARRVAAIAGGEARASVHPAAGHHVGRHEPQRPTRRQHLCRTESAIHPAGQLSSSATALTWSTRR